MTWQPIETAPVWEWLLTCVAGEKMANITRYRVFDGEVREWIDRDGRTTVTHSTFKAPTHWMPLPEPPHADT